MNSFVEFYVLLTVYPCTTLQVNPTRCTILLNIFISLLYMFRTSMFPSSGENYCIYATMVFVTPYDWRLVFWLDFNPSSRHVSGIHVSIIRKKLLYLCDTGICHSVWVASGLLVGFKSNQETRRHPYRVTNTRVAKIQ